MRKLCGVIFLALIGLAIANSQSHSATKKKKPTPPRATVDYFSEGGTLEEARSKYQGRTSQVFACIGQGPIMQDGTGCPTTSNTYPHLYYLSCDFADQHKYDTDIAAAKWICITSLGASRFGVKRVRLYSGHKCGYIIDDVGCFFD